MMSFLIEVPKGASPVVITAVRGEEKGGSPVVVNPGEKKTITMRDEKCHVVVENFDGT